MTNDKHVHTYRAHVIHSPFFLFFLAGSPHFPAARKTREEQARGRLGLFEQRSSRGRGVLGVFFLNKKERDPLETVAVYQATTNEVFYAFHEFFIFVFIPRYTSYSDSNELFNKL